MSVSVHACIYSLLTCNILWNIFHISAHLAVLCTKFSVNWLHAKTVAFSFNKMTLKCHFGSRWSMTMEQHVNSHGTPTNLPIIMQSIYLQSTLRKRAITRQNMTPNTSTKCQRGEKEREKKRKHEKKPHKSTQFGWICLMNQVMLILHHQFRHYYLTCVYPSLVVSSPCDVVCCFYSTSVCFSNIHIISILCVCDARILPSFYVQICW